MTDLERAVPERRGGVTDDLPPNPFRSGVCEHGTPLTASLGCWPCVVAEIKSLRMRIAALEDNGSSPPATPEPAKPGSCNTCGCGSRDAYFHAPSEAKP